MLFCPPTVRKIRNTKKHKESKHIFSKSDIEKYKTVPAVQSANPSFLITSLHKQTNGTQGSWFSIVAGVMSGLKLCFGIDKKSGSMKVEYFGLRLECPPQLLLNFLAVIVMADTLLGVAIVCLIITTTSLSEAFDLSFMRGIVCQTPGLLFGFKYI